MAATVCYISRLAKELLAEVFLICVLRQRQKDISELPVEHAISHVCSRWRHISTGYPSLWSHLTFSSDGQASFDCLYTRYSRTKTVPLHIQLKFTTNPSGHSVHDVFDLLEPSVGRWNTFHLHTTPRLILDIFDRLRLLKRASNLEDLSITSSRGHPHEFFGSIFSGYTPNLQFLVLVDVPTPNPSSSIFSAASFTRLHIQSFRLQDAFPILSEFLLAISHCILLERIQFKGAHTTNWSSDAPGPSVYLFKLNELILEGMDPANVAIFVRSVRMPSLKVLDLRFLPTDAHEHFEACNALAHILTSTNPNILKSVTDLRLAQFACGWEHMDNIFSHLDSVEDLLFECRITVPSWLFRLLVPRDLDLANLMSTGDMEARMLLIQNVVEPLLSSIRDDYRDRHPIPVYLPRLRSLHVSGTKGKMLQQAILRRERMGVPLQWVWLSRSDTIEDGDKQSVVNVCGAAGGGFNWYTPEVSPYSQSGEPMEA